jgi:hypothetical protein
MILHMNSSIRPSINRRRTRTALVGGIAIGGDSPIAVQSMTNTDTANVTATVAQVKALADAGSELVRITVNTAEAAAAVPVIRERLDGLGCAVPLIGDFHFNGHKLLTNFPDCARALAKYRINPGNVGRAASTIRFATIIERPSSSQAGAHRRELGQPRPGPAEQLDGRERAVRQSARRGRCNARGTGDVGNLQRRIGGVAGLARRSHHPGVQGLQCAGPDRRVHQNSRR